MWRQTVWMSGQTENSFYWKRTEAPRALQELYSVPEKTYRIGETEVPLYYLESSILQKTVKAPPMAEELVYQDGKILIMNESASDKYIFGKLTRGKYVYGYEVKE